MSDAVTIKVVSVRGSAPRAEGTQMVVRRDEDGEWMPLRGGLRVTLDGTIGGGQLEFDAIGQAVDMLRTGARIPHQKNFALGPQLGQCCGGAVRLQFTPGRVCRNEPDTAIWIWGAGHVGRAIVRTLAPLPGLQVVWIDERPWRFADGVPENTVYHAPPVPTAMIAAAGSDAHHLILTHSHKLDLDLCHTLLNHGFASCGLIGSATKRARFRSRLAALGHRSDAISCIRCPIGDPTLGKHPQAIAIGVAAEMMKLTSPITAKEHA